VEIKAFPTFHQKYPVLAIDKVTGKMTAQQAKGKPRRKGRRR
jgi:hypothetical protein